MKKRIPADPSLTLLPEHLMEFEFCVIAGTVKHNWRHVCGGERGGVQPPGLVSLFHGDTRCRDVNRFVDDMQHIRRTRNDVAHSRRLFTRDDVVILYKKVDRWVTPLGVDLMEKVEAYRRKRPKFLSELAPRARELRHVFEKSG